MALIPSFIRRPSAILRIPDAITRGLSPTAFINELKGMGLSYRKTLMLSDWRSVSGIEAKKDLIKYVRKDRKPSMRVVPDVEWEMGQEYMYKVRVMGRMMPDKPIEEHFVNIMSDNPMSPLEVEQQVTERWAEMQDSVPALMEELQVVGAYHRIDSPFDEE